jgi:hypothetical protein
LFWKNDFRDEAYPQKTNSRYSKTTNKSVPKVIPEKGRGGDQTSTKTKARGYKTKSDCKLIRRGTQLEFIEIITKIAYQATELQ